MLLVDRLQKRWKIARDAYFKSRRAQPKKSGSGAAKITKYVYHDQLQFLEGIRDCQTENNLESTDNDGSGSADGENTTPALEEVDASASSAACHPQKDDFKRKRRGTSAFEDSLLAFLTDSKEKEDNKDRSFLMSLLPTVKTFNSNQKLIFRPEVLETMMRIKQTSNLQSYPANTSSLPQPPTPYPHSTNSFLPTMNQYHDPYLSLIHI